MILVGLVLVFIGADEATFGTCTVSGCIPSSFSVGLALAIAGFALILVGVVMGARGTPSTKESSIGKG